MLKKKGIKIIFILILSMEIIIIYTFNFIFEKGSIINKEENGNNLQYNNDSEGISIPNYKAFKTDIEYILQYKGGELEPEWNWIKNISILFIRGSMIMI